MRLETVQAPCAAVVFNKGLAVSYRSWFQYLKTRLRRLNLQSKPDEKGPELTGKRIQKRTRRTGAASPNLAYTPPPQMRMEHRHLLFEMLWEARCCLKNRVGNFLLSRPFQPCRLAA
jgi:hypothetical protein